MDKMPWLLDATTIALVTVIALLVGITLRPSAKLRHGRPSRHGRMPRQAPSFPMSSVRAATPEPTPAPELVAAAEPMPNPAQSRQHRSGQRMHGPPGTTAAVIPAHNEEAVIEATLKSVLAIYLPQDVYVFCDACTDQTAAIARRYLPSENVIESAKNVGKSRGIELVLRDYIYPLDYVYVSFVDADTTLDERFLVNTLKVLRRRDVACTVGQVKSRWYPTNVISVYRSFVYALWQMVFKRLQSIMNAITIASGCSSTWKVRVLQQLEFDHAMSTEDFSLTIQVHRKRLGTIKYVSSAVVWTQDPFSVRSYSRQVYRWNRAWWESVRKYQLGLRWLHLRPGTRKGISVVDVTTGLLVLEIARYSLLLLVLPALLIWPIDLNLGWITVASREAVLYAMAWQYGGTIALAVLVSAIVRRPRIALYSPVFLFLAYLDTLLTIQALASTIRRQYRHEPARVGVEASVWKSPERRKVA
jgi:cellulose synthase/poly-beta-1,6-N-acetylglucosamine synthase-like glycosyltransferase